MKVEWYTAEQLQNIVAKVTCSLNAVMLVHAVWIDP